MKGNTKKYLKLSLILYVVILSVAIVGTLAWFVLDRKVEVTPEATSKVTAGKNVEISIDGSDSWGNEIKLQQVEKMPDVSMTPDGTFWYPTTLNEEDDSLKTGEAGKGFYRDVTNADGYFIKIPLKIKANEDINLYLDRDSFVKGTDLDESEGSSTTSKNAIAGAARVAFFERKGETKTLKTVWEPNEKYQLFNEGENSYVKFDGQAEDMKYLNVIGNTVPEDEQTILWEKDKLSIGQNKLVSRYAVGEGEEKEEHVDINRATVLLELKAGEVSYLDIYIWIEGTDRESHTLLSGGSIDYKISLVGAKAKGEPEIDIEKVVFDNGFKYNGEDVNDQILWSKDGERWSIFSLVGNPNVSDIKYIRVKETEDTTLGPIREFTPTAAIGTTETVKESK